MNYCDWFRWYFYLFGNYKATLDLGNCDLIYIHSPFDVVLYVYQCARSPAGPCVADSGD